MRYLIVIEPTPTGYSAYSPDLPGCASTGPTRDDCERNTHEAIAFHLDGLRAEGGPVRPPATSADLVSQTHGGPDRLRQGRPVISEAMSAAMDCPFVANGDADL